MKKTLIFVLAILIIGGGVYYYETQVSTVSEVANSTSLITDNANQVIPSTATAKSEVGPQTWKTYQDNELGISFNYPSNWGIPKVYLADSGTVIDFSVSVPTLSINIGKYLAPGASDFGQLVSGLRDGGAKVTNISVGGKNGVIAEDTRGSREVGYAFYRAYFPMDKSFLGISSNSAILRDDADPEVKTQSAGVSSGLNLDQFRKVVESFRFN